MQYDPTPQEPNLVFVLANEQLFYSTVAPGSFSSLSWTSTDFTNVNSFYIDPEDPNRVLVENGSGLEESLNEGETGVTPTWRVLDGANEFVAGAVFQGAFQADPDFTDVTDQGSNQYVPGTIYSIDADGINFKVTEDYGTNWVTRSIGNVFNIATATESGTTATITTTTPQSFAVGQLVTIAGRGDDHRYRQLRRHFYNYRRY